MLTTFCNHVIIKSKKPKKGGTKMMRHFHTRFDQKNLTGNAGLVHLGRFAQKLGLADILSRTIDITRGDNA